MAQVTLLTKADIRAVSEKPKGSATTSVGGTVVGTERTKAPAWERSASANKAEGSR